MNEEAANQSTLSKKFALLAFAGFGVSLLVHLISWLGINITGSMPFLFILLHLGIFVFFIPMMISSFTKFGFSWRDKFWNWIVSPLSPKIRYLIYFLCLYMFINFFISTSLTSEGNPAVIDGKYVLTTQTKGKPVEITREITENEYNRQNAYIVAGFSGHWMVFYLIPALYFWRSRKDNI